MPHESVTDENPLHRRALHSAGHAILADVQEIPVACLRVHEHVTVADRGSARFIDPGVMLDLPQSWPVPPSERSKLAERIIRTALAGPIAEQVLCDEDLDVERVVSDEVDWGLAWKTGEQVWSAPEPRIEWIAREAHRLATSLRLEWYRHQVSSLADELLREGTLGRDSVRAVIDRARREMECDAPQESKQKHPAPITVTPVDLELFQLDRELRHVAARAVVAAYVGMPIVAVTLPRGRVSVIGAQDLGRNIVFECPDGLDATTTFLVVRKLIRIRLAGAAIDQTLQLGRRSRAGVRRSEDWRRARDMVRRSEFDEALLKSEFECLMGVLSGRKIRQAVLDVSAELAERGVVTGGWVQRLLTRALELASDGGDDSDPADDSETPIFDESEYAHRSTKDKRLERWLCGAA